MRGRRFDRAVLARPAGWLSFALCVPLALSAGLVKKAA
jgi:hypothetical protein